MHCRSPMCGLVLELNDGLAAVTLGRSTLAVCRARAHGAGGPCSGSNACPQHRSAVSSTRREGRPRLQQRGSHCAASCARHNAPSGPQAAPSRCPQPAASGVRCRNSLQWSCGVPTELGSCVVSGAGPRCTRGLSRCAAARGARAVADSEHCCRRGGPRAHANPGA